MQSLLQAPSRGSRQLVLKDLKLACADTSLSDWLDFIWGFILLLIPLSLIPASYVCLFASPLSIRTSQGGVKSFATCASHITVVTMFYGPAMIMYMRPRSWYDTERDRKLALLYNVISAFLNPIMYSLWNKDVKRAFLKVLGQRGTVQWLRMFQSCPESWTDLKGLIWYH